MTEHPSSIVPDQEQGASTNVEYTVTLASSQESLEVFKEARRRFFDINHWEEFCGAPSAAFALTDEKGNPVDREPRIKDHFRIDIPGPGSQTGDGFDWVQIEEIEEEKDVEKNEEFIAIRVRPATNPTNDEKDIAHFFTDAATSNFILRRSGLEVTAGVLGRNEKPNTQADHLVDKARNATVGVSAAAGVSNLQWQKLVEGIVGK